MLKHLTTKSKKTAEQKAAERKKAEQDPFNYKRRDPTMYNPFNHIAMMYAHTKAPPGTSYKEIREATTRRYHGIPSTMELEMLKEKEAQRMFRGPEVARPARKGYEFKILPGPG